VLGDNAFGRVLAAANGQREGSVVTLCKRQSTLEQTQSDMIVIPDASAFSGQDLNPKRPLTMLAEPPRTERETTLTHDQHVEVMIGHNNDGAAQTIQVDGETHTFGSEAKVHTSRSSGTIRHRPQPDNEPQRRRLLDRATMTTLSNLHELHPGSSSNDHDQ